MSQEMSDPSYPRGDVVDTNGPAASKNKPIRSVEVQQKINNLKSWSVNTYKFGKQVVNEKLGRTTKTVDPDLEKRIEALRETQAKYNQILTLSKALNNHMANVISVQKSLMDLFSDLAMKQPELHDPFTSNAEMQRTLVRNGEQLVGSMKLFTDSMDTMINKTMQDTILTARQYESARIQYDAYRNEVESFQDPTSGTAQQPTSPSTVAAVGGTTVVPAVPTACPSTTLAALDSHQTRFESLHKDVDVKLSLLEENRLKVMKRQLVVFERAFAAYMSECSKTFNSTLAPTSNSDPGFCEPTQSFLETK